MPAKRPRKRAKPKPRRRPVAAAAAPRPATMTRAEYARHRRVSRMAVTKAIRSGRIRLHSDGRIDVAAADAAWLANTDPSRAGASTPPDSPAALPAAAPGMGDDGPPRVTDPLQLAPLPAGMDYNTARAAREYNAALRLQQQRLFDEGRLLDSDEWYDTAYNAVRSASDLMQTLADRLAPMLVGLTDHMEIHRILTEEHERLRQELMKAAQPVTPEGDEPEDEKEAS